MLRAVARKNYTRVSFSLDPRPRTYLLESNILSILLKLSSGAQTSATYSFRDIRTQSKTYDTLFNIGTPLITYNTNNN